MDLNKTCRACLKTATNPILHSLLDDPLKSMFYECTFVKVDSRPCHACHFPAFIHPLLIPFQVKPAEPLPFNLCSLCVALCDAAYNFREMCEQNDRKIRMPDMQFIVLPPTPVPVVQQKTLEPFVEKHEPVFADRFIRIDDAPEKEAISAAYSDADPFEEIVESGELVEEDGGVEEEEEDPAAQEQQPEQQEEVFEGEEMEYTMDDNDEDEERDDEGAVEEVDDQQIMSEIILDEDNDNNYTEEEVYEHEKHLETEEHETNQYTTAVDPTESQQCQFCLLDFAEKADLMAHYADDHQYEMYSCPSCNEVLATMNEWRSHVCRLSSVSAARAKKKIRVNFSNFVFFLKPRHTTIVFLFADLPLRVLPVDFHATPPIRQPSDDNAPGPDVPL